MPKLTQNVFPAYRLMFYNFLRDIKRILVDSLGFRLSFTILESLKELKSFGSTKENRKKEKHSALLLSFNCSHSSKWSLIVFNSKNVATDQSKIDLLKLTDYPIFYHKRMHTLCVSFSPRNLRLQTPS